VRSVRVYTGHSAVCSCVYRAQCGLFLKYIFFRCLWASLVLGHTSQTSYASGKQVDLGDLLYCINTVVHKFWTKLPVISKFCLPEWWHGAVCTPKILNIGWHRTKCRHLQIWLLEFACPCDKHLISNNTYTERSLKFWYSVQFPKACTVIVCVQCGDWLTASCALCLLSVCIQHALTRKY
jgi:hypothetical protein